MVNSFTIILSKNNVEPNLLTLNLKKCYMLNYFKPLKIK